MSPAYATNWYEIPPSKELPVGNDGEKPKVELNGRLSVRITAQRGSNSDKGTEALEWPWRDEKKRNVECLNERKGESMLVVEDE